MAIRAWWLLAAVPAMALAQDAGRGLSNYATAPAAEPFRETVFGIEIDDPYRWMERADRRAELATWVNASSEHSTTELAALPGRAALLAEMETASRAADSFFGVQQAGGKIFYEKLSTGANVPVLMVRENGQDRVLLDPMAGTDGKTPRAISSYVPSPDGRHVAIHVAEGGAETGAIRFYDVATGLPGTDVLTPVWGEFTVGWIDDRTVTYTRMAGAPAGGDQMKNMVAYVHRIGTPIAADKPLLGAGLPANGFAIDPAQFPLLAVDPTSRWVIGFAANARAESPLGFATLADVRAGRPRWTMLATYEDRINGGDAVGDTLYYLTSRTDPKGELRALTLGPGASLARSRQVMRSDGRVLTAVHATTSGLYVETVLPSAAS